MSDVAFLKVVREFANNILAYGRDRYRDNPTPLFVDGLNIHSKEHIKWVFPGGRKAVISNLANQQNMFRVLTGLSSLTGEAKYKDAAKSTIEYHFQNLQDDSGLLYWGGHCFIDLKTLDICGPRNCCTRDKDNAVHELKNCFPYYELMFEVDASAAAKYIKALWNAHVYNWSTLEISRHGQYGLKMGRLWENNFKGMASFSETSGLSFLDAGNDLIYAACTLYKFTGDRGALTWGKRLEEQYIKARDPHTGLGVYQFTQPRKIADTQDDSDTLSKYGDRAKRQFGLEFGDIALEGKMLLGGQASSIYYNNALMHFKLIYDIGEDVSEFLKWTIEGMKAFYKYAYVPKDNMFRPMFTSGHNLSGYVLPRDGYYGKKNTIIKEYPADSRYLLSCIRIYSISKDDELWQMAREIAKSNDLGDIGTALAKNTDLNRNTKNNDARTLFAVLDLYQQSEYIAYLQLAKKIGENIIDSNFHHGYFVQDKSSNHAYFNSIEPLALLTLHAAMKGVYEKVPDFLDGSSHLHAYYQFPDGMIKRLRTSQIFV